MSGRAQATAATVGGAQLPALAIGGGSDRRCTDAAAGIALGRVAVTVSLDLEGEPPLATAATITVFCEPLDGSDPVAPIERAGSPCMVSDPLRAGDPVTILPREAGAR